MQECETIRKMSQEPLQIVPVERWQDLQSVLLSDWPRGLPGYNVLQSQAQWKKEGFDYGFQVYSPFGDEKNGFIAVNKKASSYELVIQYPKDDIRVLEETLRTTKLIQWESPMKLTFTAYHVIAVVQRVITEKNILMELLPSYTFVKEKDTPLFKDVRLPPGFTFELLTTDHINLIDSKWPHRYPTSPWYFQQLIATKSGYGLFKNGELTSWVLNSENGCLTHLYTLEEHRNRGYAVMVLKLMTNELLKKKRHVLAFCMKGNEKACNLYKKLGFKESIEVSWCYLTKETQ